MKKVMVFIDGSNMYHNLNACAGRHDIDFEKFAQKLCGQHRELIRTYYYNVQLNQAADPKAYAAQQKFLSWLHKTSDLEVRLGRQQRKSNGAWEEKGVDVKIAVDMLTKAHKGHYDVAILVSGDSDLSEVVHEVKEQAKHVELAVFSGQQCFHLQQKADRCIDVDSAFLSGCWLR